LRRFAVIGAGAAARAGTCVRAALIGEDGVTIAPPAMLRPSIWRQILTIIAMGTLLRLLPNLRLDDADHLDWRPTFVLRGLNKLPARW
jgi:hypothetical protein